MTSGSRSSTPSDLSEPPDDFEASDAGDALQPPTKRRRTGHARSSPQEAFLPSVHQPGPPGYDAFSDVSSDSTASVPNSPRTVNLPTALQDEESMGAEQMRRCSWDGCDAGELRHQDELVDHVHNEHVNNAKKAKFACEWSDCKAKGKAQMSAYALRAHIRSHTKEKPFYCLLPECDKCFTRSDALAKHMRTVHENENITTSAHYAKPPPKASAGFPTDHQASPQPTGLQQPPPTSGKAPKSLKLVFNSSKNSTGPATPTGAHANSPNQPDSPLSPASREQILGPFPSDVQFTAHETSMPRDQLFALLRRQMYWAETDAAELAREVDAAEERRKHEWLAKELVFENLLEAELAGAGRRDLSGILNSIDASDEKERIKIVDGLVDRYQEDSKVAGGLPLHGSLKPWYREPGTQPLSEDLKAQSRNRKVEVAPPPPPPVKANDDDGDATEGYDSDL